MLREALESHCPFEHFQYLVHMPSICSENIHKLKPKDVERLFCMSEIPLERYKWFTYDQRQSRISLGNLNGKRCQQKLFKLKRAIAEEMRNLRLDTRQLFYISRLFYFSFCFFVFKFWQDVRVIALEPMTDLFNLFLLLSIVYYLYHTVWLHGILYSRYVALLYFMVLDVVKDMIKGQF